MYEIEKIAINFIINDTKNVYLSFKEQNKLRIFATLKLAMWIDFSKTCIDNKIYRINLII